jgi:hypothetical protein
MTHTIVKRTLDTDIRTEEHQSSETGTGMNEFTMENSFFIFGGACLLAYVLWTAIYRLFFHPLASIPGPKPAAVTWWYDTYYDCFYEGGGRLPWKTKELHERYGPIIRVTPNEVHIADPEYVLRQT